MADIKTAETQHILIVACGVFAKKKHDTHDYEGQE
jgi:hypothetical protein